MLSNFKINRTIVSTFFVQHPAVGDSIQSTLLPHAAKRRPHDGIENSCIKWTVNYALHEHENELRLHLLFLVVTGFFYAQSPNPIGFFLLPVALRYSTPPIREHVFPCEITKGSSGTVY